jgi:hypothetical protein
MSEILYGTPQPWYGGYKYHGNCGYWILLKMCNGKPAPVDLPDEIAKDELDAVRGMFDIVEETVGYYCY